MGGVAARRSPLTTAISGSIPELGITVEFVVDSLPCFSFAPQKSTFLRMKTTKLSRVILVRKTKLV
jgi:hypothetical protein